MRHCTLLMQCLTMCAGVGVPYWRHTGAGAVDDRWLRVHIHLGLPGLRIQVQATLNI